MRLYYISWTEFDRALDSAFKFRQLCTETSRFSSISILQLRFQGPRTVNPQFFFVDELGVNIFLNG